MLSYVIESKLVTNGAIRRAKISLHQSDWFRSKGVRLLKQRVALTGCNTTGPPSRAAPWWVTLRRNGLLQTTTDDNDRCETAKLAPLHCVGGPVTRCRPNGTKLYWPAVKSCRIAIIRLESTWRDRLACAIWWTLTKERRAWCNLQVNCVWHMPERFATMRSINCAI